VVVAAEAEILVPRFSAVVVVVVVVVEAVVVG
jgi:hypothetical protein